MKNLQTLFLMGLVGFPQACGNAPHGNRGDKVGAMAGVRVPSVVLQHQ